MTILVRHAQVVFPGIAEPVKLYGEISRPSRDSADALVGASFLVEKDKAGEVMNQISVMMQGRIEDVATLRQYIRRIFKEWKKDKNYIIFEAKNKWDHQPKFFDPAREELDREKPADERTIKKWYSRGGNFVNIMIRPYLWKNGKGMSLNLEAVQFVRYGDPATFGGVTADQLPDESEYMSPEDVVDEPPPEDPPPAEGDWF